MSLTQGLSDDQIALLGCVVAFLGSGALMTISYYLGRSRPSSGAAADATPATLPLVPREVRTPDEAATRRRAA